MKKNVIIVIFLGIVIGVILYMTLFSSSIIQVCVHIINFAKKTFKNVFKIISIPFVFIYKLIKKIFFKPISFITINIKKITNKTIKKIKIPNVIRQKNTKIMK